MDRQSPTPDQTASSHAAVWWRSAGARRPILKAPLTYFWTLSTKPAGSSATLSNANIVNPTFSADRPGAYTVQLVVNDGLVNSATDLVQITTANQAPIANAGPDQADLPVGSAVTLNGSQSLDADGDTLSYSWEFVFRPALSAAVLVGANTSSPTFAADRPGLYRIKLSVTDSFATTEDTVDVTTVVPPTAEQAAAGTSGVSYYNPARIPSPDGTDATAASVSYYNPAEIPSPAGVLLAGHASVSYFNTAPIPSPDHMGATGAASVSYYNPAEVPSPGGVLVAGHASVSYYNPAPIPEPGGSVVASVTSVSYFNPAESPTPEAVLVARQVSGSNNPAQIPTSAGAELSSVESVSHDNPAVMRRQQRW